MGRTYTPRCWAGRSWLAAPSTAFHAQLAAPGRVLPRLCMELLSHPHVVWRPHVVPSTLPGAWRLTRHILGSARLPAASPCRSGALECTPHTLLPRASPQRRAQTAGPRTASPGDGHHGGRPRAMGLSKTPRDRRVPCTHRRALAWSTHCPLLQWTSRANIGVRTPLGSGCPSTGFSPLPVYVTPLSSPHPSQGRVGSQLGPESSWPHCGNGGLSCFPPLLSQLQPTHPGFCLHLPHDSNTPSSMCQTKMSPDIDQRPMRVRIAPGQEPGGPPVTHTCPPQGSSSLAYWQNDHQLSGEGEPGESPVLAGERSVRKQIFLGTQRSICMVCDKLQRCPHTGFPCQQPEA